MFAPKFSACQMVIWALAMSQYLVCEGDCSYFPICYSLLGLPGNVDFYLNGLSCVSSNAMSLVRAQHLLCGTCKSTFSDLSTTREIRQWRKLWESPAVEEIILFCLCRTPFQTPQGTAFSFYCCPLLFTPTYLCIPWPSSLYLPVQRATVCYSKLKGYFLHKRYSAATAIWQSYSPLKHLIALIPTDYICCQ